MKFETVMDNTEKKGIRVASAVIAVISLLVILSLSAFLVVKDQGIYLIGFTFLYVLIPGFALLISLDPDICKRFGQWTPLLSFFEGFSLIIIQYYFLNTIRNRKKKNTFKFM